MNAGLAVAAGTLGSVLGALVNYMLAVLVGEPVLRRYGKYVLDVGALARPDRGVLPAPRRDQHLRRPPAAGDPPPDLDPGRHVAAWRWAASSRSPRWAPGSGAAS